MTLRLAVGLDGAGWHPAAWRCAPTSASALFSAAYWTGLVAEADRGGLDFVTLADGLGLQSPDDRVDRVRGRLDAALVAARVAPLTRHVGLAPTVTTTHTEPFHVSTAIATLDYVSGGRAGWDVAVSPRPDEAAHVGRRPAPGAGELLAEAADAVEVVRRLWDSWADDAVVRDVATGRFVDRDRLRYTDFAGRFFAVKGPSIVPRPPQGQPLVTTLAQLPGEFAFAARAADVVFTTPVDEATALAVVEQARGAEAAAGRAGPPLLVFADLVVFLDERAGTALGRRARLDALDPVPATNAAVFAGDPDRLADLLLSWRRVGVDGFRLWPATLPYDLATITRLLVPALRRRRARVESPPAGSLRARLGLPRPANRYATAAS